MHYEKPAPGDAIIVELDEMWHYLGSKKTSYGSGKLIVEKLESLLTGNVEEGIRGCPACFLILKGVVISSHETNRFS